MVPRVENDETRLYQNLWRIEQMHFKEGNIDKETSKVEITLNQIFKIQIEKSDLKFVYTKIRY